MAVRDLWQSIGFSLCFPVAVRRSAKELALKLMGLLLMGFMGLWY